MSRSRKFVSGLLDLFGNFSFRTGYLKMRCSKSCYLRDLELVDLFDNRVIEQVYFKTGIRSVFGYRLFVQNAPLLSGQNALFPHLIYRINPEVIHKVIDVRRIEDDKIGLFAFFKASDCFFAADCMGGV